MAPRPLPIAAFGHRSTTLGYPVPLPDPFIVGYPEIEGMASLEQFATWGEEYSKDHPWDTRKEAWVWVGSVAVSP